MTIQARAISHDQPAGVVYIDRFHAIVAKSGAPRPSVVDLERGRETPREFLFRVAHETTDCDRLVVMGPGDERLAFEREYVTIYQRPDRLVELEPAATATRFDLLDRLRLLER